MTLLLQDTLVISPKTKQQVEKNTAAIAELQEKSAIAYHFKGSKPTFNDLPTTGNEVGDVWDVQDTGANYGWTGTEWDELGPIADLEPYLTKEEAATIYSTKTETGAQLDEKADKATTYTKEETDTLLDAKADKTEVYRSLSSEQESLLLLTGKYNDEKVNSGEIFLKENGTFGEYNEDLDLNIDWKKDGVVSGSLPNPTIGGFGYGSFVNNTFVISGHHTGNLTILSSDGVSWTSSWFNDGNTHYHFSEGNGVIISARGPYIYTHNPDNILEILSTSPSFGTSMVNEVSATCYGSGKFIANTLNSGTYYSEDGISWTSVGKLSGSNLTGNIAYGNGRFVFMSGGVNITYTNVSEDGVSWTQKGLLYEPSHTVLFGQNKFVLYSNNKKKFAYSEDGISWTFVPYPDTSKSVSYFAFDGERFIAQGSNTLFYSFDGMNWESMDVSNVSGGPIIGRNGIFVLVQGNAAPYYLKFGDTIKSINPLSYTKEETDTLLSQCVQVVEQNLTDEQKTQARENVEAAPTPIISSTDPTEDTAKQTGQIYVNSIKGNAYIYTNSSNAWTNPMLSENGTPGGSSFAVFDVVISRWFDAYNAFDGIYGANSGWQAKSPLPSEGFWALGWYNPKPVKIEKFVVYNRYMDRQYSNGIKDFVLQGSDDGVDYVDIQSYSSTEVAANRTFVIDNPVNYYKYHRLKITSYNSGSSDTGPCIEELILNGVELQGDLSWIPLAGNNSVSYTYQSLTDAEKEQARENIGAASVSLEASLDEKLAAKQDTLTAGENITISEDNVISATGASALSELEDVTITTPTEGQGLVYDGEKWENKKVIVNTGTFSSTTQESIGFGINSVSSNQDSISIGNSAISDSDGAIAIGRETKAKGNRVVVIGGNASATSDAGNGIAIGTHAEISGGGAGYQIAIGAFSAANAERSIQLGGLGTNNEAYSFKVGFSSLKNYKLLDGNTGHIPAERLAEIMIVSDTAPTTATVGALGDLYKDTSTGKIYKCTAVDTNTPSYTWEEFGKASEPIDAYTKTETDTLLNAKADKATTLSGYGITDAYTKEQINQLLNQAYVTKAWTLSLPLANWVENKQTFTIQGLTADSSVDLNPVVPTTREEMIKLSNAGLFISALGENSVTIECINLPTEDLTVKLKREMTTNAVLAEINAQLTEINGV